ncbi:hypothetical protein [Marinomonas]|jgi:hypothetical protein|uniref:Uncharacterized protein n=2 Tax=Marinomonas TaxID=28253 RepID=F2JW81_MARM1|nr:hypothetical protein [Marinomonas]ADZ89469.1 hypothetical protein Marme_0165 [Marinomonas mediterranea MMB-1]TDO97291.1 hypothetical protein DFP79_2108 [Marinomonas balearica]WCN07564.1 hypothetical protein GV055_00815 [Marinomonas mediterranea]WCN11662.1 hypothetical protein GV054_00825 [Marinomonas mediterranea]WCN15720.1 hypothetical protein GV053_00815 [Marinomonas mediterranea MMB-1]
MKINKFELMFYAGAFVSIFGVAALVRAIHSDDPLPDDVGPCILESGLCTVNSQDFNGITTVQFEDGIRLNRRIHTELQLPKEAENAQSITLVLEGREMYLGVYEYPMFEKENNRWISKVVIPLCTDNRMQWKLQVRAIDADGDEKEWAYTFDIENPNEAV